LQDFNDYFINQKKIPITKYEDANLGFNLNGHEEMKTIVFHINYRQKS
jgi:hypothetical protein